MSGRSHSLHCLSLLFWPNRAAEHSVTRSLNLYKQSEELLTVVLRDHDLTGASPLVP